MEEAHGGRAAGGRAALYVVATPIGNLKDITRRAIEVLAAVDRVAAEDTRVAGQLLAHLGIAKPLLAVHQHNEEAGAEKILAALARGESVALVTDAGTPGVSDPGARVVRRVRAAGFRVVPIPGPSALTAALSVAGLTQPQVLFYGFLPAKPAERRAVLESLKRLPYALAFYESPHRIRDTLEDLATILGEGREVIIGRELTKLFEEIHVGPLGEAVAWLTADSNRSRGEFVLIVSGSKEEAVEEALARRVLEILLAELPASQAARLAAAITGVSRKILYAAAVGRQEE